ncbi:MAG: hypothetical protein ACREFA_02975 [Stellaceae bacterium]
MPIGIFIGPSSPAAPRNTIRWQAESKIPLSSSGAYPGAAP